MPKQHHLACAMKKEAVRHDLDPINGNDSGLFVLFCSCLFFVVFVFKFL